MYKEPDADQATTKKSSDSEEGIDLIVLSHRLWRGKYWIIGSMGLAVCCVAGYFAMTPPEYTASLELLLDPSDLHVADNVLRPPMQSGDWQIAEVENQLRLLTSGNVLRRVIDARSLTEDPEFSKKNDLNLSAPEAPFQEAMRNLAQKARAKRAERTYVITLEVSAGQREKAVDIANAFVDAFAQERSQAQMDAAVRVASSLNENLQVLRQQATDAEERLEDYKKRHDMLPNRSVSTNDQPPDGANEVLAQARLRTWEAQAAYDQALAARRSSSDLNSFSGTLFPNIVTLRNQYAQWLDAEAEAVKQFGQQSRRSQRARAKRLAIARLMQSEMDKTVAATGGDLERARASERDLASRVPTYEVSGGVQELEHELWAIRTLSKAYEVREVEVAAQQRLDMSSFRVISPAMSIGPRSWPPPVSVLMSAALVIGAALGVAAALLCEGISKSADRGL